MHWIIGTAGHIDHGKTTLVKALTGQDTDRLKEEKERGISIDLGFAHLDLPRGIRVGVVDVPGHERFIRNMVAGAHGMDLVLFTVAADDGVMPQTEEHLDILHVLGVTRAIFVITKADRVARERIDEVAAEIRDLVAGTSIEHAPAVPFSAITNEGLDRLRELIATTLTTAPAAGNGGLFRLPVDRAFVSAGHGLIVTGTAISGEVRPGESVVVVPSGDELRVRSIEVHDEPVQVGTRGQRIALNLVGKTRAPIGRGDVMCHAPAALVTDRFDARLEVRPRATAAVRDHQRIRVHLGTAERLGRVIPLGSDRSSIAPGQTAYCQIELNEPLHALRGDHFIVRDETAQWTIGGGIVIHPSATKHRKRDAQVLETLQLFERGDAGGIAAALIAETGRFAIPLAEIARIANCHEEEIRRDLERSADVRVIDAQSAIEKECRAFEASLVDLLERWHIAHPLLSGISLEEARSVHGDRISPEIFRALVEDIAGRRVVVREGNLLRLPDHRIAVPEQDRGLVEQVRELLARTPLAPPDVKQLATELRVDRHRLNELLGALEKQRVVVGVAPDLYFLGDSVDQVRDDLIRRLSRTSAITTAEFRDYYHTSRKYAIPLLEYFDRQGLTVRAGEIRRLKTPRRTDTA